MESLNNIDKKKAAIIGVSTFGALLVSYFVYRKYAKESIPNETREKRRLRQKIQALSASRQRIVGANTNLRNRSAGPSKGVKLEQDLQNATHGTKTIYFDSNDLMYTEEEVLSGRVGSKSRLTKMIVKVPENERKQLNEVQSNQTRQRLQDFLK